MDKLSFLKGLALGLAGKPLEFAPKKEPVAYLYNGVRLPKLPEWDRVAYPYAVIMTSSSGYALYVCQQEPAPRPAVSDDPSYIWFGEYDYKPMRAYCYEPYSEWGALSTSTSYSSNKIFWTNTDILNTDGTTYLAASEPTPVYE